MHIDESSPCMVANICAPINVGATQMPTSRLGKGEKTGGDSGHLASPSGTWQETVQTKSVW